MRSYASEVGLDPDATVREFLLRFDLEAPMGASVPIPELRSDSDGPPRLAPVLIKLVVGSLVAVAIILYLTRARHAEDESGGRSPDFTRRTSRRLSLDTSPKPPQLP